MKKSVTGFTIVEVLIVIVVIAILATISVVAYRGIQDMANDSAVQAEVNQFFKQEMIADLGREHPDPYASGNLMESYLENNINISMKNYHQSEAYPFILVGNYNYKTSQYEYDIAAVSKSGKVFVATRDTGGVSRSIGSWTDYRVMLQGDLDYFNAQLQNVPEWCNTECVADYQDQRAYYQAELTRVGEREARGDDFWHIGPGGCGVGTIIGSSYVVYLYKASERRWVSASNEDGLVSSC